MTSKYSSTSVETTLQSAITTSGATSMVVASGTGTALMGGISLAAGNVDSYTVAIDVDTINEEIVFITNVSSDTMTIVRGQAGTSAVTHNAGATVKHVLSSFDLINFNNAIQPATLTAKGDIYAASASGIVGRVAVGANGTVLIADSSQARGLKWDTAPSKIGQIVTATTTNITNTAGAGFIDVSGLSVTITPTAATSKVLIITSFGTAASSGAAPSIYFTGYVQLVKTATALQTFFVGGYYPNGGGVNTLAYSPVSVQYIDSPATTSATTYKMQINNVVGAATFSANPTGTSIQITAMEILV